MPPHGKRGKGGRIGQYRHRAEVGHAPPIGGLRRARRRFPHYGLVFLVSGGAGVLACGTATYLLQQLGAPMPAPVQGELPPAPTLNNLLFGVGVPEALLTTGFAGWWLWRSLWNRAPAGGPVPFWGGRFQLLVTPALLQGPLIALAMLPVGAFALYLRTAPEAQPLLVRPLFALLAAPVIAISAIINGTIPLVLVLLGGLMGLAVAVAIALLWPAFPPEPPGSSRR
jgi:hypothetical protein